MEHTHKPIGQQVEAISGSYFIEAENKLAIGIKEILYLVGSVSELHTCCGSTSGGFKFITVPGFIKNWKTKKNKEGDLISDIEPVRDDKVKQEIKEKLTTKYYINNIEFW